MDRLLRGKPIPLSDERAELFGLIDRFSETVETYRKQYAFIVDRKNSDLRQMAQDKQSVLDRLSRMQREEIIRIKEDHASRYASLDRQAETCRRQAALELQKESRELVEQEEKEKAAFHEAYKRIEAELDDYLSVKNHIEDVRAHAEEFWGKAAKRPDGSQNAGISSSVFADIDDAMEAVGWKKTREVKALYKKILDYEETLPKKVAYSYKKRKCLEQLAEMAVRADAAYVLLEKDCRDRLQAKKQQSDDKSSAMHLAGERRKQEIIRERDDTVKRLSAEMERIERQYQSTVEKLKEEQKAAWQEQEAYYVSRLTTTQQKWVAEQEKCSSSFVSLMEELYPADQMNAWLRQLWKHPRSVEDYSKIDGLQFNVLIGAAEIDISGWYKGETGKVILEVLKKYALLFGTNKEQAIRSYREAKIVLPYTISIEEGTSLHISYADQEDERIKMILNALGMRMLCSVPACLMRFQLFDANGIGAFGRLLSLDPARKNNPSEPAVKSFVISENGSEYSDKADIAKQIAETRMTLSDLAKQLTNYRSISEFNLKNPLSRQIYRPVFIMNFPAGLEEKEVRTLTAMADGCSKWGFSMVLAQPDKAVKTLKEGMRELIDELKKNVLNMRLEPGAKGLRVSGTPSGTERAAQILIYGLPAAAAVDTIAAQIRRKSVEASRVLINFSEAKGICPAKEEWYTQKGDDGIVIPVGYLEGGEPFRLQFDDQHIHAIIMGNIRSGKTNLLHVMMTNMMLRYGPEEAMIYLIDFKYGLDFRIYTQYNLPNFKTISINNEPEFALAMLRHLEKEQKERSSRMGTRYHKISEYNADNPKDRMHRIFLIVDELYELTKRASDEVQKSILRIIDSLAHQTGAFGIHMILCGQDLDKIEKFETIRNQCIIRMALHCDDEQVRELMEDAGVARMHTIDATDQGAGVFSLSGGSNPQIEHTTYLGTDQQIRLLEEIHRHYMEKQQITDVKVLLTKVSDDPNHAVSMFVSRGYIPDMSRHCFWVGDPVSMDRALNLCPAENLWLVGGNIQEEALEAGISFLFFSALSLAMEKIKTDHLDMICTNCNDQPGRNIEEEEKDLFGQLTSRFPKLFQYSGGERFREVFRAVMGELDDRRDGIKSCKRELWWFLARPETLYGVTDEGGVIMDLGELLVNGPKYNIHVVLWNADPRQAQKLQLDRNLFKDRVCLEMTAEDARFVNGRDIGLMPTGYKALLIGNNTMRFRIYDLPDGRWMNALVERLDGMMPV